MPLNPSAPYKIWVYGTVPDGVNLWSFWCDQRFAFGGWPWHPDKNPFASAGYAAIAYRSKDARLMNTDRPCTRTATLRSWLCKTATLRRVPTPL